MSVRPGTALRHQSLTGKLQPRAEEPTAEWPQTTQLGVPGVPGPPGLDPFLHSLSILSLYSFPPMVPSEGMGQAGAEGVPERYLWGHAKHSEHGKGPPGLELSCCRYSLGGPTGPPAPESLALQVGGSGRGQSGAPSPRQRQRQTVGCSWELPFEFWIPSLERQR